MRREEAELIDSLLSARPLSQAKVVVELGASERHFRETSQPHIHAQIHEPLLKRGVEIITTDLKGGDGIDVSGDLLDPSVQSRLQSYRPDLVLCCNIFEHVIDRVALAGACDRILPEGGHILVTVPFSYPYHLDPIDTMFRPKPSEIAMLFPSYELVHGKIFDAGSYLSDMRRHNSTVWRQLARTLVRSIWPWKGVEAAKSRFHRWLWIGRPYRMSLALLRKTPSA
jgi:hypothetical protein